MSNKGALVLTHLQSEGICNLGNVLEQRGFNIKTMNTPRFENLDHIDALRPDLLLIMGGPVGVYQKDYYPFIQAEIEIARKRLQADMPIMGICLGAQIMAAALGKEVRKGEHGKELGWKNLDLTEAGKNSVAKHLGKDETKIFQWHGDTFDLPDDSTLLASSEQYKNQIFSHGQNAMALQCHPEVRHEQLREWYVMFQEQVTGQNPLVPLASLRAETEKYIQKSKQQTEKFFNAWLDERGF